MNIVFLGSSNFAIPSLEALLESRHKVACVVTQPDKQKGRGLEISPTAIKEIAQENKLPVYQPQNVNSIESLSFLKDLNPDLFVVIAYGQILSQAILDVPKIIPLNIHASLLPKYRGAAPINWALIHGEKETGVTVMKMAREMDAGPIILQRNINIPAEDNSITLEGKLSVLAAEALMNALDNIEKDNYKLIPQDEKKVNFAPKLKKKDGLIDWSRSADQIYNLIRGLLPWPGAFAYYNGKLLKIYKALVAVTTSQGHKVTSPGEIVDISEQGITVATGKSSLVIEELQLEGKRRMAAGEFARGHKISVGEALGGKPR